MIAALPDRTGEAAMGLNQAAGVECSRTLLLDRLCIFPTRQEPTAG